MAARDLILTSLLLGSFAAAGGAYGILLSLGFVYRDRRWFRAAHAAYLLQCVVALTVVLATPLDWWWKLLIAASDAAYYFVPPMTWRYLTRLHRVPEETSR